MMPVNGVRRARSDVGRRTLDDFIFTGHLAPEKHDDRGRDQSQEDDGVPGVDRERAGGQGLEKGKRKICRPSLRSLGPMS